MKEKRSRKGADRQFCTPQYNKKMALPLLWSVN